MKKFLSLLLIIVFVLSLTACDSLLPATNNAQNNPNIQNLFSGMTEMSEVECYFDKTLGLNIFDLSVFRYYELIGFYTSDLVLLQYKQKEDSSYQYILYGNACSINNGRVFPGGFIPLTEDSSPLQSDNTYIVTDFIISNTIENDPLFGLESFQIISDNEGKVLRVIFNTNNTLTIDYNNNSFISAINSYVKSDNKTNYFTNDELYDMNHHFENDNVGVNYKYEYSYNKDGSAKRIVQQRNIINFDGVSDSKDEIDYEYTYDKNGYRISSQESDDPDVITYVRDNKGLLNSLIITDGEENHTVDIKYSSDGLFLEAEKE